MKLVEILARELGEWPEGFEYMRRSGNTIYFCESNGGFTTGMKTSENEDGCHGAWVTREMWETERARMNKWNGEGLPPVGVDFEFSYNGKSWEERTMLFNDGITCLMAHKKYPSSRWHYKSDDPDMHFRPAKSDREKWIEAAMNYWDHEMPRVSLEHIYDAGLAKLPD